MKLKLNIDTISDKLYQLLLEEFKKEAMSKGIDWDNVDDQQWEIICKIKK